MSSKKPVGIFDSGVGGLTVLRAVRRLLPNEPLIYLGDTARVPYGNRSAETILKYTEECCAFLAEKEVKAIVVACNTASAHSLPYLQHRFHFPFLGVIEPGVEAALEATRNKRIGILGTRATIGSEVYAKALSRLDPSVRTESIACPLFVPLVEENWIDHPVTESVARDYLSRFSPEIDAVILGCTHYPLLRPVLGRVLGEKVELIDSAEAVATALQKMLESKNIPSGKDSEGECRLYATDLSAGFQKTARRFLGENLPPIQKAFL